jgi:hypothetical protein
VRLCGVLRWCLSQFPCLFSRFSTLESDRAFVSSPCDVIPDEDVGSGGTQQSWRGMPSRQRHDSGASLTACVCMCGVVVVQTSQLRLVTLAMTLLARVTWTETRPCDTCSCVASSSAT